MFDIIDLVYLASPLYCSSKEFYTYKTEYILPYNVCQVQEIPLSTTQAECDRRPTEEQTRTDLACPGIHDRTKGDLIAEKLKLLAPMPKTDMLR